METDSPVGHRVLRTVLVAVGVVLAGSWGAGAFAQGTTTKSLPRVYVFTELAKPGEPVLQDQAARQASVKDLREELQRKPVLLEIVDAPDQAEVTVEVVRREAPSTAPCLLTVRLSVAGRNYGRQFQGEGPTWKEAASLVADAVRRWVNESYDAPND
jgi:hypothetical protein